MSVNNFLILSRMAFDRRVITSVFKMYNVLKEDKNFNVFKYIKMMKGMLFIKKQEKF